MKKMLLFAISVVILHICAAQTSPSNEKHQLISTDISFVSNKKINYSIVLMSCDTCRLVSTIGYRVVVDLSEKEEEAVKRISNKEWLSLLDNNKSDWAANLILYSIFNRDASFLSRRYKRKLWLGYLKQEDLKYWKKKLSTP